MSVQVKKIIIIWIKIIERIIKEWVKHVGDKIYIFINYFIKTYEEGERMRFP